MKKIHSLITIIALAALVACGGGDKKVTPSDNTISPDTTIKSDNTNTKRPPEEKIPRDKASATTTNNGKTQKNEILANIDKYLVSKASFATPPPGGGISNAGVTVENTLPNITINKAIIEVSILMEDGAEFRTDYYVMINLEPGETKTVKVPNAARGNSIVCHVVKLKSDELTNGELLLVGSHYVVQ